MKDRARIVVPIGEAPPKKITVEGVHFIYESAAKNTASGITHYVYRSQSGWRISFTDRQFSIGVEVDPNRKSDWWPEGQDLNRSHAAKSVPKTITTPAWGMGDKKRKGGAKAGGRVQKRAKKRAKSEDLFL